MKEITFKTTPFHHQYEAYMRFRDAEYFALLFEMGTGKSKTAIDIAQYKYINGMIDAVLIIAPNNVHTQWVKEQFPAHCGIEYDIMVYNSSKLKNKFYSLRMETFLTAKSDRLKVFAVNVEAFSTKTVEPYVGTYVKRNKTFIINDESTRIKNPSAQRSKRIHRLNKYGCRCNLTGTPATKSPFDLWSQYEFLHENYFGCNYFVFQHRFGVLMRDTNPHTGKPFNRTLNEQTFEVVKKRLNHKKLERASKNQGAKLTDLDYEIIASLSGISEKDARFIDSQSVFSRYKNLDALREQIAPVSMSIRKTDCFDLPDKIYVTLPVTMPKDQRKIYNNLKEELRATYQNVELTVVNKLTLTLRLQQVVGGFFPYNDDGTKASKGKPIGEENVKVQALLDDLEEVDFEATKVIVWACFVPELELLYKELSKQYNCCLYYGAVDTVKRDEIKEDFQAGKYDIFIGNTATAGFGLNLQNATLQYFYSNNFRVEARLQAEDRSHRYGVKQACVFKDITMKNSVDDKILKAIREGKDLNEYFKDTSINEILEEVEDEDY
jgi:SNF2 family DNA or RNA helicase